MRKKLKNKECRQLQAGDKRILAVRVLLQEKSLILLRGSKGYIMCGYLNLKAANRFKDVAVKITGVSTIEEALRAKVHSFSTCASRFGIYKGQSVKDVLKIIG